MTLEDLYRLLRTSHVQAQGIVDTLDDPLVVLDQNLCVISANPAFFEHFRVERDSTLGLSLFALGNGQWDISELRRLLGEVIPRAQAVIGFEVNHDFPSIGPRTVLVSARRLAHPDNNSTSLLVVFSDVTEARQASAETDILLAETRHRIQNLSAVVHALAYQTKVEGRSAQEYRDVFLGRLEAFFSAKDMINQSGAAGIELAALVDEALDSIDRSQIAITPGPSLRLESEQVRPLCMILHELTTNALKYGALSIPEGVVHLAWDSVGDASGRNIKLDWIETNGPAVRPPASLGFGAGMIERSARSVGGKAELRFEPGGLNARIVLPITRDHAA